MNSTYASDHGHGLDLDGALDFLNTHGLASGQPVDRLQDPGDASGWFEEHGILHASSTRGWSAADLARVRAVRDALREIVDAVVETRPPSPAAVELVNGALAAGIEPRLELEGSTVRVGHRHGGPEVDEALAAIASPIITELGSGRPDRFRTCASETCRWTFFDASPTGRRRWCDMKVCGNRAKAARHRQRTRVEAKAATTA